MADHGFLTFVLHGHLPYVLGHGTWPHGEEWLWEAAAETYQPLVELLARERARGHAPGIAFGVTPVLLEMLRDPRFAPGYSAWLERKVEAAEVDAAQDSEGAPPRPLARHWVEHYRGLRERFEDEHGRDLPARLAELRQAGIVQVLGGPATHGYSPLLSEGSRRLQFQTGMAVHEEWLGHRPAGVWLPECAWSPGMEPTLAAAGVGHCFVDAHLVVAGVRTSSTSLLHAMRPPRPRPPVSRDEHHPRLHRAHDMAGLSTAVLARDPATSHLVWSGEHGYPGSGCYLEFHKRHYPGGHRYWSVTGANTDLGDKQLYDPEVARQRIQEQARHFVHVLEGLVWRHPYGSPPLVVAMYDAELFGHWWYEGPQWLEAVLGLMQEHPRLAMTTPEAFLEQDKDRETLLLPEGSWGDGGDHRVWEGDHAREFWGYVRAGETRLKALLGRGDGSAWSRRIRAQAARSLLLLQASDWPFLLYNQSSEDYAIERIRGHAGDLLKLLELAERIGSGGDPDADGQSLVQQLETRDRVFANVDPGLLLAATREEPIPCR